MASRGPMAVTLAKRAPSSRRRWQVLRIVALALVLLVAVGTMAFGKHRADFAELQQKLSDHTISHVQVQGALPPGSSGYGQARIQWREHGFTRFVDVEQASSRQQMQQGENDNQDASRMLQIIGSIDQKLRGLDPQVKITHTRDELGISGAVVLGWQIPGRLAIVTAFLWLLTLGLLINGPQPRLATKWAWAWGLLSPLSPAVIVLYLLGSAPLRGPNASDVQVARGRRVTGGWAFLALVLFAGGIAARWFS